MKYEAFLATKRLRVKTDGIRLNGEPLHPMLYDFQHDITRWALRQGRACLFADCGLGKTPMQLVWADHVAAACDGRILIVAPLAVSHQI